MKNNFSTYFNNNNKNLVLIDASAFIYRAYHALPPMIRPSDNQPVGAILGFCSMTLKFIKEQLRETKPHYLAMIFDSKDKTFRETELFGDYKINRKAMPEDLQKQITLIKEAVSAFDMPRVEVPRYEADDIIATYCHKAAASQVNTIIVSSDKDMMQLVTDQVVLYDPIKDKKIDHAAVVEKFGVNPNQVIDIQALTGDSIDNIPGLSGIGPKTAANLVKEFGNLENIFANTHRLQSPKHKALFENPDTVKLASLSKNLAKLEIAVPLPQNFEALAYQEANPVKLRDFFLNQEFRNLIKQLEFLETGRLL